MSAVVLLSAASVAWLSGCRDNSTATPVPVSSNETELRGRCDDLLGHAVTMCEPSNLGLTSIPATVVDQLNQWRIDCGVEQSSDSNTAADDNTEWKERLLSPTAHEFVKQERYNSRDVAHIRDARLHRRMLDFATGGGTNDLERTVELFFHVMRNVALMYRRENDVPFAPYHIWIFGRGSVEDRAWVFAELLRQMGVDAVIVRPQHPAAEDGSQPNTDWLVGVMLRDNVYLFDMLRGTPVPALDDSEETVRVRQPLTLEQLSANPAHWPPKPKRDVNADSESVAAVTPNWEGARAELIGHSAYWSSRMRTIQLALRGEQTALIYDSLTDGEFGPGMLNRVSSASSGRWQAEELSIWPYPEQQLHAFSNMNDSQRNFFEVMRVPYSAPIDREVDPEAQTATVQPQRLQWRTRLSQLFGEFEDSIQKYMLVRTRRNFPTAVMQSWGIPEARHEFVSYMHAKAAEDAMFWSGVCQMEVGNFDAAIDTFREYVRQYSEGQGAMWRPHCRWLWAVSEAEQGSVKAGVALLEEVPAGDINRPACEFLIQRWSQSTEQTAAPE